MHRKPQSSSRASRLAQDHAILNKHGLQVVHHNLHIIITSHRHEEPLMNHIVPSLQLLRQRLENVQFGQRHVRSVPFHWRVLLVRNVKAIDMSLG